MGLLHREGDHMGATGWGSVDHREGDADLARALGHVERLEPHLHRRAHLSARKL